jgi:hypothetical protein
VTDAAGHAKCGCSERGALLGEAGYLWYKALGVNRGGRGVSIEDQRKRRYSLFGVLVQYRNTIYRVYVDHM